MNARARTVLWSHVTPALVTCVTTLSVAGVALGDDSSSSLADRRSAFASLIEEQARLHGVRADLLHAVIRAESAYRPDAVSSKGAVGLMQLMPATAERYGVRDRTDPRQNIAGGAAYLSDLHRRYSGDLKLVLAAYNAGEDAVAKHGRGVPPYAETRSYVQKVLGALDPRSPRCWRWASDGGTSQAWGGGRCASRSPRRFRRRVLAP